MSQPGYRTILADPPWQYTQPLAMRDGVKRSSASQYPTLSVQQICDLYTPSVIRQQRTGVKLDRGTLAGHEIADVALLALWITAPLLLEGVHQRVCHAWGFTPKQIVPWVKGRIAGDRLVIQPGMGALTRGCVEYLILATRGKYTSLVQSHSQNGLLLAEEDAVMVAPKSQHSRKPDDQYRLVEALFPGPRLELFARREREGWTAWGDAMPSATRAEEPPLPLEAEAPTPTDFPPATYEIDTVDGTIVRYVENAMPEPPVSWS